MEGSFAIRIGRGRRNRIGGKNGGRHFDFSPGLSGSPDCQLGVKHHLSG